MPISEEIPLAGGNVNAGVVRVGNTVRRAIGPNSGNVHKLLEQLERRGYGHAPRFLGIDASGREIPLLHGGFCDDAGHALDE